jgi:glycosyltransferase involved in cell wall biosynthesis
MEDLTIVTCNYNTADLIQNLIKSIKFTCPVIPTILVIDTGKSPTNVDDMVDDVIYYPHLNSSHGEGVNKSFDKVKTRYVLLVDSDILFLKNIQKPFEKFKESRAAAMGKIVGSVAGKNLYDRIEPWYCFLDLQFLKNNNIKFFDADRTKKSKKENIKIYDVGSTMLEDILNNGGIVVNVDLEGKYFKHYGGMSWRIQSYNPENEDTDVDFCGTHPHKILYDIGCQVRKQYDRDIQQLYDK